MGLDEMRAYSEIIKANIEYVVIANSSYPVEFVKSGFYIRTG